MANIFKSGTTVSQGSLKRNNFIIGLDSSVISQSEVSSFYAGFVPPSNGFTVYAQKEIQGPSIRYTTRDEKVREFQMDIKKLTDKQFGQSVCCTDVIFEKS